MNSQPFMLFVEHVLVSCFYCSCSSWHSCTHTHSPCFSKAVSIDPPWFLLPELIFCLVEGTSTTNLSISTETYRRTHTHKHIREIICINAGGCQNRTHHTSIVLNCISVRHVIPVSSALQAVTNTVQSHAGLGLILHYQPPVPAQHKLLNRCSFSKLKHSCVLLCSNFFSLREMWQRAPPNVRKPINNVDTACYSSNSLASMAHPQHPTSKTWCVRVCACVERRWKHWI